MVNLQVVHLAYVCVYMYGCVYVYACVYVWVYMCVCMGVCMWYCDENRLCDTSPSACV